VTKKIVILSGIFTLLVGAVVILGQGIIPRVVGIYLYDSPAHPYFQPTHAFLFYFLTPIVILSSIILWLLPGIFLALAISRVHRFTEMVIWGFGYSIVIYAILISIVKLVTSQTPSSTAFIGVLLASSVITWGWLAFRVYRGDAIPWPLDSRVENRRLVWSIAIPVIVLITLFPVIFWQDMNGDGLEVLEMGRSLSRFIIPRTPDPVGVVGLGIGMMLPMAFPIHWFIALFGAVEASARLPLLLYLPVVFCLLVELVEWRAPRKLGVAEETLMIFALGIYTVAMGYNASYDPYFSDLAAPAAIETLTVLCILASIYFLWRENWRWFFIFSVMSYLCRPNGLIVLGLMFMAAMLVMPEYRKRWSIAIMIPIAFCLLLTVAYDKVLLPWISGSTQIADSSGGLLDRIRYIRLIEPYRLNFALFPSGILPFLALFLYKWQDKYSRMITIIALGYFAMFFFFAHISMHHFVPVMLLPIVVLWRMYLLHQEWERRVVLPVVAIACAISLWLSLPRNFDINRTVRLIGEKTLIRIGDNTDDYRGTIEHAELFYRLIRPDWQIEDRSKELVSTPLALIYYANRPKRPDVQINYIVQAVSEPAPQDFYEEATHKKVSLYVQDADEWKADRFQNLDTDFASSIYAIPRGSLFYYWDDPHGTRVIDLMQVGGVIKRYILGLIS
jgi:hypothetical protein